MESWKGPRSWAARAGPGGDGEDEGPVWTPGPASRSYLLGVRPEASLSSSRLPPPSAARSTFCSIIAQLTEETQPIFETTLKSRAVSEGSDVRFTCVVTGYPEPEVTWYKDDKELDRYCGLPKYQITRQGNRHTLQLYRCQEEDAAIYQASARNAKGIVSCSGVLEVGTMTEYQIHQRWFAKLKTKAAAKMRELEQGWGRGPEAAREVDPDRPQRKRRLGGAAAQGTPPPREPAAPPDGEAGPGQPPGLGLVSRLAAGEVTTNGEAAPDNREAADAGLLTYLCEAMERGPQGAPQKASGAKKTKKAEQAGRGLRRADAGKTARGRPSENCVPGPDGSGSCGPQRPLDVGQTQPRGRATQGPPGPAGAESARKPASAAGTQGRAQNGLARAPAPAPAQALAPASVKAPARAIAPAPAPAPAQDLAPAPASVKAPARAPAPGPGPGPSPAPAPGPAPAPAQASVKAPAPAPAPAPGQEVYFSLKDLYAESTRVASPQDQEGPSGTVPRETRCEGGPAAPRQPAPAVAPPPVRPFNRKRFAPPKSQGEPGTDSQPSSPPSRAPEPAAQRFAGGPPQAAAPVPTPPARRRHGPQDSPPQGPAGRRAPGELRESPVPVAPASPASSREDVAFQGCSPEPTETEAEARGRTPAREDRTRAEEDRPSEDRTRAEEDRPREDRTRAEEDRPSEDRTRAEEDRPREDRTRAEEDRPSEDRTRAEDGPSEDRTRAEEDRPSEDRTRAEEDRPSEDRTRAEEDRLREDRTRAEEGAPTAMKSQREESGCGKQRRPPELPPAEGPSPPRIIECREQAREGSSVLGRPEAGMEQPGPDPVQPGPAVDRLEDGLRPPRQEARRGEALPVARGGSPPAGLKPGVPTLTPLPGTGPASTPTAQPSGDQALLSSAPPQCLGLGTPAETAAAGGSGAWAPGPDGSPPRPRSCDPGLIDSLRNYLLLLLQLSSAEPGGEGPQPRGGAAPAALAPPVAVAGLSPRTSRRVLERAENDRLVQSAQSLLLSPCTSRRLAHLLDQEAQAASAALSPGPRGPPVPAIVVGGEGPGPAVGGPGGEGAASPGSSGGGLPGEAGGPGPLSAARGAQEPPREEGRAGLPAATPQELALGARRKRFLPKGRAAGDGETAESEGGESPTVSPRRPRKGLVPGSPGPPGRERRSPTQGRRADTLQVPSAGEEPAADPGASPPASDQDAELAPEEAKTKKAPDLLKAPQVIRKIRAEQFPDASGSLKLWCQFFNVLGDSVLTWAKDQRPVGEVGRRAGDEGPAALAIVQASEADCGLYRCTIRNQHGEASTDFCLGPEVLSRFISGEEGEVGEEIEVTPMVFAKGLADSGCWGDKLFGRLAGAAPRGCVCGGGLRKASRARVIYGLEPVFASGRTCVIKVSSLLVFGPSSEASLVGRNYDVTIQSCKTQNMSREYCKIFAAEARAVPGFGEVPEIVPLYLVYRPASNVPYATLEEDLGRPPETVCSREWDGAEAPAASSTSEAGQKCRTFQHWLYQWTNGSFLVTDLAGVGWKMTDVQIAAKLRGYQGLKESCSPALLDQFVSAHKCNAFCAMLGLQPLWGPEAAHPPAKAKGPKSPSAGRKGPQLSPQPQKRGLPSPQGPRRSAPSTRPAPLASDRRGSAQPPPHEGAPEATPPEEAGAAAARGVETSLPGD